MSTNPNSNSNSPPLVKLPYTVVSCSSFDAGYESHQLEQQATHTKGWQSSRFPSYPQVLILQFNALYDIRKIQILSHQAKIASSIELYVGREDPTSNAGIVFLRLGYLSLDPNDRSQFKARELKSVYVSARGSHLKLVIKKCHKNAINLFDQVGIIAINVVGNKPADEQLGSQPTSSGEFIQSPQHGNNSGANQQLQQSNPNDPPGLDPVTAAKFRELHAKKRDAIEAEDFDEAKRIKSILDGLTRVSSELTALERKKRQAINDEDFDTAKNCKKQIELLRSRAVGGQGSLAIPQREFRPQQQQQPHDEDNGGDDDGNNFDRPIKQSNSRQSNEYSNPDDRPIGGGKQAQANNFSVDEMPVGKRKKGQQMEMDEFPPADEKPAPAKHKKGGKEKERAIKPAASSASEDHNESNPINSSVYQDDPNDSRALNVGRGAAPTETPDDDGENGGNLPPPEPMNPSNRKDAEPLLDGWDENLVSSLYSKNWNLRAFALKQLEETVAQPNEKGLDARSVFNLIFSKVLKRSLTDKVSQVVLNSCALMEAAVRELASQLRAEEIRSALESVIPSLIDKLSASNVRERDAALSALLFVSFHRSGVPGSVVSAALAPLKKKEKDAPLPIKSRARLLLKILLKFGINDSMGLSIAAIMKLTIPQLAHRDATVRDGNFNLAACVAQIAGKAKIEPFIKDLRGAVLASFQARMADISEGRVVFTPPEGGRVESSSVNSSQPDSSAQATPPRAKKPAAKAVEKEKEKAPPAAKKAPVKEAPAKNAKPVSASPKPPAAEKPAPAAQKKAAAPKPAPVPLPVNDSLDDDHPPSDRVEISVSTQFNPRVGSGASLAGPDALAEDSFSDFSGKCQFCGLEDPTFTDEKLDLHYWQDCPMLSQCKWCEQVIEIPTLNDHLIQECESESKHEKCDRCQEAISEESFAEHKKSNSCRRALPNSIASRCPLCHLDIGAGEEGWTQHLLIQGCTQNPRKLVT